MDESVIGRRLPKPDALAKATGRAEYIDDLVQPQQLYGKILRSPFPHARIVNIDTTKALQLPGVKAVLTAKDIPGNRLGFGLDNEGLKKNKVRYIGDEVAAVAAIDEATAIEALEIIKVDYEILPAVFDPFKAMEEGAPLVHEGKKSNLSMRYNFVAGDPENALEKAEVVVTNRFELPFVTSGCMGTHGCLASFNADGNLTVWTVNQAPFLYQHELAEALGMSGSKIRVIQPTIGGGFGTRLDVYPYELACVMLAKKTGRPVKIVFTREEEFIASRNRQPMVIDLTTGADRAGRLVARAARVICDNGAYNSWGVTVPVVGMHAISSLYQVPNVRYQAENIYTNNPYSGSMRGYGNPQSTFAVETQMDELAEKLGMDPLEFRLLNTNKPGEITPQKMKITTCGLPECLTGAAESIAWKEKRGAQTGRGVGMAAVHHVGGGARVYRSDGCGIVVKIDDMGRVTAFTGATDIGQGSDGVVVQIVAETLGIKPENVQVVNNDTDLTPWDVGSHASRTTFIAGNAARLAAEKAREKVLEGAAKILKLSSERLVIKNGKIFDREDTNNCVDFSKVVRSIHFQQGGQMVIGEAFYDPPTEMQDKEFMGNVSAAYAFGAHAVEVEVDQLTGRVKILDYVAAHDLGRAINPMAVEGQIDGGVTMGLGYALSEEMLVREGKILNPNFLDYRVLTASDAIRIKKILVETNDSEGPYGAKGIGEPCLIPVAAAVANAIYDAIGVRIRSLPMTPEKILSALKEKQK